LIHSWIKVVDELPNESCEVLAFFNTLGCQAKAIVWYSSVKQEFLSLECDEKLNIPTHWMYSPNEPNR